MLNISFSFGPRSAYSAPVLSLTGASHNLSIEFKRGEHVFTSPDIELGTIHALRDAPLIGRLIFRYTYDELDGVDRITVCNEDFESADGMTLMTFPLGREDASCFERASGAGFAADEIHHNGVWNTRSPLLPGVSQILKDIARDATRAMLAALETHDEIFLRIRMPFPTLPLADYEKMCVVFCHEEPRFPYDGMRFEHLRAEEGPCTVWDVFSQFGGTELVPANMTFANVIGSTPDRLPQGATSWIQLWSRAFADQARTCATLQFPKGFSKCKPGAKLLGGHIIRKPNAEHVQPGSDDVSIIPICYAHNHKDYTGAMMAREERRVVLLKNYRNP